MASQTQAVLFDLRDGWTAPMAEAWLAAHDMYPMKRVHKTKNKLRYRLRDPHQFERFRTVDIDDVGIQFIVGWL